MAKPSASSAGTIGRAAQPPCRVAEDAVGVRRTRHPRPRLRAPAAAAWRRSASTSSTAQPRRLTGASERCHPVARRLAPPEAASEVSPIATLQCCALHQHDEQESGRAPESRTRTMAENADDVDDARRRQALAIAVRRAASGRQDDDEGNSRRRACARANSSRSRPRPAAGRSSGPGRRSTRPAHRPPRRTRRPRRARTTDRGGAWSAPMPAPRAHGTAEDAEVLRREVIADQQIVQHRRARATRSVSGTGSTLSGASSAAKQAADRLAKRGRPTQAQRLLWRAAVLIAPASRRPATPTRRGDPNHRGTASAKNSPSTGLARRSS